MSAAGRRVPDPTPARSSCLSPGPRRVQARARPATLERPPGPADGPRPRASPPSWPTRPHARKLSVSPARSAPRVTSPSLLQLPHARLRRQRPRQRQVRATQEVRPAWLRAAPSRAASGGPGPNAGGERRVSWGRRASRLSSHGDPVLVSRPGSQTVSVLPSQNSVHGAT